MKNKILASLLAVCLFAGLAVPAFADYYSSVEGDATKATIIDFYDDGKVIKDFTIKNGEDKNIADLVRVFEDKNTLILDKSYLNYALEGDSLSFGINESTVTAIDSKGEINVVVTSSLDSKIVGKLKIKAAPGATEKFATGFRFKDTTNTITTQAGAEKSVIKVVSIPAGSKFNATQKGDIDAAVTAVISDAVSHATVAGASNFNDANTLTVTGLRQGETITFETKVDAKTIAQGSKVTATATIADTTKDIKTGVMGRKIAVVITVPSDYAGVVAGAAGAYSVASLQAAVRRVSPSVSLSNVVTSGGTKLTTVTLPAFGAATGAAVAGVATTPVVTSTLEESDKEIHYVVADTVGQAAFASVKKNVKVIVDMLDGNNQTTVRSVTASTTLQNVEAKAATAIGGPGAITIEVGEVYDTDGKMAYGPSASNVDKAYALSGDYYDSNANAMDYAAVDGLKIKGVKTGVNKVVASLNSDTTKTATIIVNVVAKGTKPATPDAGTTTTVLSAWAPKIGVGETANIVVKATKAVTYTSLDTAIATVDAAGKLTAVKEGTAKIKVQEEGKDAVYVSLTVTAKTTTPGGTTDVPQTAVVALAPLF